jgi:hypothetical protein
MMLAAGLLRLLRVVVATGPPAVDGALRVRAVRL